MSSELLDLLEGIKSEVHNRQSIINSSVEEYKERLETLRKLYDMAESVVISIDTVTTEIETFNEEFEEAESENILVE